MAEIQPFKGLRYNPQKVNLKEVITEPYDRIPPHLQEKYYRRNPYNVVRIILGKDQDPEHPEKDKYKRAKIYLDQWQQENILIREDQEALYLYEQEFEVEGEPKKRTGLIARVKLEQFSSRKVLPHEKTFPKHKQDRLNLLRATNTNTGQVFLLYKDDDLKVTQVVQQAKQKAEPGLVVRDEDNFVHKLWVVKDKQAIKDIQEVMKEKPLIIADGHHRYETSLNYQKEMIEKKKNVKGNEPFNYIMMTLFPLDDPGLVILPTYRLVKGLDQLTKDNLKSLFNPYFEISELSWEETQDKKTLAEVEKKVNSEKHVFAAYVEDFKKFIIFKLKSENFLETEMEAGKSKQWKRLDVSILHSLIIDKLGALCSQPFSKEENVSYIRDLDQGIQKVKQKDFQMIFLLKPVTLKEISSVVENGELMPHKSTDFFPKLKSGLVMNPLD